MLSLSIVIVSAVPSIDKSAFSNEKPLSSETTVPPVRIEISSSIAFLLSPKPGALTAAIFKPPLSLFTTNVARACPSTSSAIISKDLPDWDTGSNIGKISWRFDIFLSNNKI